MHIKMPNLTNKIITTLDGNKFTLTKVLGYGSQGVVYETDKSNRLIKLYFKKESDTINEGILERLSFIKNVKIPKNFVTIHELIKEPYIGYVMDHIYDHKSINSYLIPDKKLSFSTWYNKGLGLRGRLFIGYLIAKAFRDLERENLSYCDISGNNILAKIGKKASIKMIDVDNIYIAGRGNAAILGTPRYIAPEVINRHKNPDVLSDNYSLAVLIFELLRVGHPYISDDILDGSVEDEDKALSGSGEYVTDANSTYMLPSDIVFTSKLKDLFYKCFVNGKVNRIQRPSAKEFELALLDASNKLIKCPSCNAWHYPRKDNKSYLPCPWCDSPSKPHALLNFYEKLYMGDDYKQGRVIGTKPHGTLVNTYILRENANNFIKNFYILKADTTQYESLSSDNYMAISNIDNKYIARNCFNKKGIYIYKEKSKSYLELTDNEDIELDNRDCIYFDLNTKINVGDSTYSFIKMAKFLKVS